MTNFSWQKIRNILTYPHHWQHPAKTEEYAYEQCLKNIKENKFMQVVCFPWATLIDLLNAKQPNKKATELLQALKGIPPKTTLIRITVCQHIYMKDIISYFKQLKITDLYWSHAVIGEDLIEGIRIHPFPLYPVCYKDRENTNKPLDQRKYLYSFVGAYNPEKYLTPVRQWIFDLQKNKNSFIKSRNEWHYKKQVYGEQISDQKMTMDELNQYQKNSQDYTQILQESIFCLCPSGSGPNSIRLWEALGFGCIPVILSDTHQLPGDNNLWQSATLKLPETQETIHSLHQTLKIQPIHKFEKSISLLWERYGKNNFIYDIQHFSVAKVLKK